MEICFSDHVSYLFAIASLGIILPIKGVVNPDLVLQGGYGISQGTQKFATGQEFRMKLRSEDANFLLFALDLAKRL